MLARRGGIVGLLFFALISSSGLAADDGWIDLTGDDSLASWKEPHGQWQTAGDVHIDPQNATRLAAKPGKGVILNGPKGNTNNLLSKRNFGDIELHLEFNIPKGSNSGVKFEGLYEIQIADSFGKKEATGEDCGGIYPRAELKPQYHHIDKGIGPRTNAARAAGDWQTLDAIFVAPRFDADGKKTANARLVKVTLNGAVIHENVELKTPTGHAWRDQEIPAGPILLQADHGPVAFRNVRVRPYTPDKKSN